MKLSGLESEIQVTADRRRYGNRFQLFWDLLLKVNLLLVPPTMGLIITWGIWVTQSLMYLQSQDALGPRWTQKDAELSRAMIMETMSTRIVQEASRTRTILDEGLSKMQHLIQTHMSQDAHPLSKARSDAIEQSMKRIEVRLDRLLENNHNDGQRIIKPTG